MSSALDGPSKQGNLSVSTSVLIQAKVGSSPFTDRKVITLQPSGKIYVYFADEGENPSISDVSTKGFVHFKDAKESYEAGELQVIFLLAVSGTVDVKIAERA